MDNIPYPVYFAQNIRYLRERQKLSRNELAEIIEQPAAAIGEWENNKKSPGLTTLCLLADYFELSVDKLIKSDLALFDQHLRNMEIKFLILDIDGVMTDGGMYYSESGDEFKKFNSKDGLAIKQIIKTGITIGIISSGFNINLINRRADLLGIQHVYAGIEPKMNIIKKWVLEHNWQLKQTAYIGDDINDIEVMRSVGLAVCPADAVEKVKDTCHITLKTKGGKGCIREFIDHYILK